MWSILYSMKQQISNRLGVAHVRDTMMQFVTGAITRQQAMESLQVGCRLYRRETVAAYLDLFYRAFTRYGLPLEIYVDKAGFFRNDDGSLAQLGRRLKLVDVSFVFANTPEAKGKIERMKIIPVLLATTFPVLESTRQISECSAQERGSLV